MRLLLIRHGKAHQSSPTGADADRELRGKGRRQAAYLGECFAQDPALAPTRMLASPANRAWDTAAIIAEAVGAEPEEEQVVGLSTSVGAVVSLIEGVLGSAGPAAAAELTLAIVGHQPTLGGVVGALSSGPTGESPWLRTGECAVLDVPNDPIGGDIVGRCELIAALRLEED